MLRRPAATALLLLASAQQPLAESERERMRAFEKLKNTLHTMSPAEADAALTAFPRPSQPPPRQSKIDHFIVLFMENRSPDHVFGCMLG